jgi:hypothetical protein
MGYLAPRILPGPYFDKNFIGHVTGGNNCFVVDEELTEKL